MVGRLVGQVSIVRNIEEIRSAARAAGFEDEASSLAALAAPALVLSAGSPATRVGRFGGVPQLPPGSEWPWTRWSNTSPRPMAFLAEFDLGAFDPSVWTGPREGTLSFFCAINADAMYVDGGGAALVLHHPAGTALQPAAVPEALEDELRFDELVVRADEVTSLPHIGVGLARELIPLDLDAMEDWDRAARYLQFAAQFALPGTYGTPHQLLGWARFTQDDLSYLWPGFLHEAVNHGLATGDVGEGDWQLLLQIGADGQLGTSFGDGGDLFFAIPKADLAAGRFDRVQAVTDSG